MSIPRPPVVTILGHVDHGKTSLLDYIRKASVASREHGGITQHIGAYQVEVPQEPKSRENEANRETLRQAQGDFVDNRKITFIDTPGHAAFEKMRSRGARVADIAVLVVAIDDGVMPQTTEAIKHIQAAKVPIIVAVNKIDLPGINMQASMEKLKRQLADQNVLIEEYGGDTPVVPLSAKTGEGVDKLLEMILLVSEVNELTGDPEKPAEVVVIEASIDKFKGPVATLLVRDGTLNKGDTVELSGVKSKIRGMFDFAGKPVSSAPPSMPVEVLGLEVVPPVGEMQGESLQRKSFSLVEKLKQGDVSHLNVVVKADKQGSLEAIIDALSKFNDEAEHVKVISSGTGDIQESDIKLAASTSGSIVIGFNVKVVPSAGKLAEVEGVLVRTYTIIYELIEELEEVVEGMLKVGQLEEIFGTAQIIAVFDYGKDQKIAGCRVLDGNISKGAKLRLVRGEEILQEVKIKSLKKVKDEVNRVEKSDECGILFTENVPFEIGDLIQSFRTL